MSGGGVAYTDPAGKFSAIFPTTPALSQQPVRGQGLSLQLTSIASTYGTDYAYYVSFVDYSGMANPDGALTGAVAGSASNVSGQIQDQTLTRSGPYRAIDYMIAAKGSFIRGRDVVVGTRLYIVFVVDPSQNPPGYGHFLAGFKVLAS